MEALKRAEQIAGVRLIESGTLISDDIFGCNSSLWRFIGNRGFLDMLRLSRRHWRRLYKEAATIERHTHIFRLCVLAFTSKLNPGMLAPGGKLPCVGEEIGGVVWLFVQAGRGGSVGF
jgi:hypothetical protein